MSTQMEQGLIETTGAPRYGQEVVRPKKAAVERNRKWIHSLAWPTFFVTVVTTESSLHNLHLQTIIALLSYALVTAGTVGRLWCGLYVFGRKAKEFCQDGPYSICRNPLYVSAFLSILGLAIASGRAILMVALPVLLGAYYLLVIKAEERRLLLLFGREYEAYCKSTPRIFPRFASYRARATVVLDPNHYLLRIVKALGYFWLLLALRLVETI